VISKYEKGQLELKSVPACQRFGNLPNCGTLQVKGK